MSQVAQQARAYSGFSSISTPPRWIASPLKSYPLPFIHLGGEGHCESKGSKFEHSRTQHNRVH